MRILGCNEAAPAGAGGLYRGLIPPLLTSGCISSVVFSSYEMMKRHVSVAIGRPANDLNLQGHGPLLLAQRHLKRVAGYFASGFGCGVIVSVLTAPVHRVKVLLQTSNISAGKHSSSAWGRSAASITDTLHCYRTVLKDGGVRNLCVFVPSYLSIKATDGL
jgi:hypothetical protein